MTKTNRKEIKRLVAIEQAYRGRPKWNGVSRYKSKSMRFSSSTKNAKARLTISIEELPWLK